MGRLFSNNDVQNKTEAGYTHAPTTSFNNPSEAHGKQRRTKKSRSILRQLTHLKLTFRVLSEAEVKRRKADIVFQYIASVPDRSSRSDGAEAVHRPRI